MTNKILRSSAACVNPQDAQSISPKPEITAAATQLIPVLLKRGESETFYYLPTCGVCGKPILDFEQANVVVTGVDLRRAFECSSESLGTVDGAEMFRLPGVAIALHFECDTEGFKPWVRSSSVFCRDQRGPIEKLGWSGVAE